MFDNFFGDNHNQPWPSHWSRQNNLANAPFSFNNRKCYSEYFKVKNRCEPVIHHHCPSSYFSAPSPPPSQPITNMLTKQCIAMYGRNGSKAKFRFHGGIGDGCGGLASRIPEEITNARPLQLFDDLNPIDMLIKAPESSFIKNHGTHVPSFPVEANNGTGMFLPVYPKKIRSKKGAGRGNGSCWNGMRDDVEAKECAGKKAIPVELIGSSEWKY